MMHRHTLDKSPWEVLPIDYHVYVILHKKTMHNALHYQSEIQAKIVTYGDFTFWYELKEESFFYTKICFVASRTLYLPSYGSKK